MMPSNSPVRSGKRRFEPASRGRISFHLSILTMELENDQGNRCRSRGDAECAARRRCPCPVRLITKVHTGAVVNVGDESHDLLCLQMTTALEAVVNARG